MTKPEFKEFKIAELFVIKRGDIGNQLNLIDDENGVSFVAQNATNNGFVKKVLQEKYKTFDDAIIIGRQTGVCYFMSGKFITTDGVLVLEPTNIGWLSRLTGLYLASVIRKHLVTFGYSNTVSAQKLEEIKLSLPISSDGSPDYEFMADYVRQIQADYVRQIQAYLKVTGLTNTVLTEAEKDALSLKPSFKEFKLGDLFEFKAIKQAASQGLIPNDNSENGVLYVVQSIQNNMVSRKVNKQWLIENNEPPVTGNKIVLGVTLPAVSYQASEFGASQVITAESEWLNKNTGKYIVSVLSKLMYRFSYGSKPGMQIYKDMVINLPVTPTGDLDLAYMEAYICATQKQVIEKLVEWNAKNVEALENRIS